jgi:hypothetical protein
MNGWKEWIAGLCPEIASWQAELIAEEIVEALAKEREDCARIAAEWDESHPNTNYGKCIATDILTRNQS